MAKKHTVSVYGCGGAGINIVSKVLSIPSANTGFPAVEYNLVDTSDSNLGGADPKRECNAYLIPGLDGAGGNRMFCREHVTPHLDPILNKFKPKDHSIVIFSLSGGSGSVIGPLLTMELLKRGENVICVCIGNTTNGQEAENTLKTIATLQGISKSIDVPVVACFYDNDIQSNRVEVDAKIERDVRALMVMLSGSNEALDSMDIHNFLHFTPMTKIPAQLVDLLVYSQETPENDPKGFIPIAITSVLPDRESQTLKMGQPFGRIGYLPAGAIEGSSNPIKPLHFIISNAFLNKRLEVYQGIVNTYKENISTLQQAATLQVTDGVADADGFVF